MTDKKIDKVMRIRRRLCNLIYYDYMFSVSLMNLDEGDLEKLEEIIEKVEPK